MIPATDRAATGIVERTLSHSDDPRLGRHVANAIRHPDGQLSKVSKHSPRKIDLTVAMVMALDRATVLGRPSPEIWSLSEVVANLQAKRAATGEDPGVLVNPFAPAGPSVGGQRFVPLTEIFR